MGFNVGGFTQGLNQGIQTGIAVRRNRQDERLRDVYTRQAETAEKADRAVMDERGMDYSTEQLDDPFLYRMVDWFRGGGQKQQKQKALPTQQTATAGMPTSAAAQAPAAGQAAGGGYGDQRTMSMENVQDEDPDLYANGGRVRRYALGGSVYGAGPQMTGNPDPRTSAPMGGFGAGGGLRQAPVQQPTMQPMQPQPIPRASAPMGGGGMQQPGMQPGMPQPQPTALPMRLGAPGMGGMPGMGGGKPGMLQPGQPMPGGGMQPRPFEGGGGTGFTPKMGGGQMLQPGQPMQRSALGGGMGRLGVQPMGAQAYAEGGDVESEEDAMRRRAAENRARKPAEVRNRTESVTNDTTKPKGEAPPRSATGRAPKYEGVGVDKLGGVKPEQGFLKKTLGRGKGLAKGAGVGYLAGAATSGAGEGLDTSTDEYYDQIAASKRGDPNETYNADNPLAFLASPEFWKDAGVRTIGVMGSVGRAILPNSWTRGREELATGQPPGQPGMPDEAPLPPEAGGGGSASVAVRSGGRAGPPRQAAAPPKESPSMDLSGVSPQEVPDFKVEDWSKYRDLSVNQMLARGVPITDALEHVDQQVTAMQQRGFVNYAQQGMALQEAGNIKGAMAAYRAAFQYFPSGSDVKFGMHNGQIVGMGIDEKTGKTVGQPMLLDAERVAAMIDNFKQPGAWQLWAKDRREFQQKMREYEEVTKPQSEGLTSAALTQADAAQRRAGADEIAARMGGSGGGASMLAHERDAMNQLSDAFMNIEGVDGDPMLARSLSSAAMQVWKRYGGQQSWPTIVEAISRAAQIEDPTQRAQMFMRLGVADPMSMRAGPPPTQ